MTILPKKLLIIHNPTAGRRAKRRLHSVLDILEKKGLEITLQETTSGPDTKKTVAERAANFDMVVAAGGDGTINDVINGLYPQQIPLALIPLGTTNVLAMEIGLSTRPFHIAKTILEGHSISCWPGIIGSRYFSLMLSVGPDAFAVRDVSLKLKKIFGKFAYVMSFLKHISLHQGMTYQVTIDGSIYNASSVIVINGRYYAGRYLCAPDAKLGIRKFQVIMTEKKGFFHALRYNISLIGNRIFKLKDVTILAGETISITSDAKSPLQIDGDVAGELPAEIGLSPRPLNLCIPKG